MTSGQIASRRVELCGQGQFEPAGGALPSGVGPPMGLAVASVRFLQCSALSAQYCRVARSGDDVAKLVRAIHRKMRIRCLRPDMH